MVDVEAKVVVVGGVGKDGVETAILDETFGAHCLG